MAEANATSSKKCWSSTFLLRRMVIHYVWNMLCCKVAIFAYFQYTKCNKIYLKNIQNATSNWLTRSRASPVWMKRDVSLIGLHTLCTSSYCQRRRQLRSKKRGKLRNSDDDGLFNARRSFYCHHRRLHYCQRSRSVMHGVVRGLVVASSRGRCGLPTIWFRIVGPLLTLSGGGWA